MNREPCFLCGAVTGDIRVSLVEWKDPPTGAPFTSGPRCVDRQLCRNRVEGQGLAWEVVDKTVPVVAEILQPVVEEAVEASVSDAFA